LIKRHFILEPDSQDNGYLNKPKKTQLMMNTIFIHGIALLL